MARPSAADQAFDLALGLYACSDVTMSDANQIRDIVAALEGEVGQQRTRAEAAEADLREVRRQLDEARYAIEDLVKALDRERSLNAAQCREADRG